MKQPIYNTRDGSPPVDRKVILINNEPGPPIVGTLVRYEPITRANQHVPVVRDEATGKEFITLGTVLPYSDRLMTMLQSLPEDGKAWEVFRDIRWFQADMDRHCDFLNRVFNGLIGDLAEDSGKAEVIRRTEKIWQRVGKILGL
jgi:hypothetical protein